MEIYNAEHWNRMKHLVEEGAELRRVIDYYQSPSNPRQLGIKNRAFEKYQKIAQELHALPEEIAARWAHAKEKLEGKVYPYNK